MDPQLNTYKYKTNRDPWFSIITCAFNRKHTLPACYESIKNLKLPTDDNGKPVTFEWIIIDDGSGDGTRELVEQWIKEDVVPLAYMYQDNRGKHVAANQGISVAKGYAILEYDSDDIILPDALNVFYDTWKNIPVEQRQHLKGVTARCIDSRTGKMIGDKVPCEPFIVSPQDMRFKYRITGEMFGFTLRSIMLEHKYPVFDDSTKFCPESIVIFEIGKQYKEAIVDTPVRIYVTDSSDAITRGSSRNRAKQNYYLWRYEVNNLVAKYIWRSPKDMLKAVVGITMDGFRTRRSLKNILKDVDTAGMKMLVILFTPVGFILSKSNR